MSMVAAKAFAKGTQLTVEGVRAYRTGTIGLRTLANGGAKHGAKKRAFKVAAAGGLPMAQTGTYIAGESFLTNVGMTLGDDPLWTIIPIAGVAYSSAQTFKKCAPLLF